LTTYSIEIDYKIRPVYDRKSQRYYAVKTFLPDKTADVILPHKDMNIYASKAFDIWSFGVLMYYMLSVKNSHLFNVNLVDDLSSCVDFRNLFDSRFIDETILPKTVKDDYAHNLLLEILKKRISFGKILVSLLKYMFFYISFNDLQIRVL